MNQNAEQRRSELFLQSRDKLKRKCKSLRISGEGNKSDMINRIIAQIYGRNTINQPTPSKFNKKKSSKTSSTNENKNSKSRELSNKYQLSETFSKTSSTNENENKNSKSRKLSNKYQLSETFSKSYKKINNKLFYKQNSAILNKEITWSNSQSHQINWKQTVNQHSNNYSESLTVQFECSPKINNSSFSTTTTENELWNQHSKSKRVFANTMLKLFQPHIRIKSIVDIILEYNGPHLLPIRYSVDVLPYLHPTIRSLQSRTDIWTEATKDYNNCQCVLDFTPDTNIMVVEDIYDEFVSYIRDKFCLRSKLSESVILFMSKQKSFMEVSSKHLSGETKQKQIFTEFYMAALNNFSRCKEYAFRLQLYGINYRYYLQKREYSPISWGSRSRCWDGEGMVLLSDGTQKQIKYLSVGDKVAVLNKLPNGVNNNCNTATVKVKIESVVNRKYEMVLVNNKLWITPYHAVLNSKGNKWQFPCQVGHIEERFEESIFNFILDRGHVLCVNNVWACTLGHDLKGDVIENPMWGSSYVMNDMWSKVNGYPNIVEYI